MVDPETVLPDVKDFLSAVTELDPDEPSARYRAIAGSNAVYVVGLVTNLCTEPRTPTFDERATGGQGPEEEKRFKPSAGFVFSA